MDTARAPSTLTTFIPFDSDASMSRDGWYRPHRPRSSCSTTYRIRLFNYTANTERGQEPYTLLFVDRAMVRGTIPDLYESKLPGADNGLRFYLLGAIRSDYILHMYTSVLTYNDIPASTDFPRDPCYYYGAVFPESLSMLMFASPVEVLGSELRSLDAGLTRWRHISIWLLSR